MINYHSKTKEELIIEIQRLQQEHNSLEGNFNKVINERKQAEKSLRRKEEQMHFMFEAMNEGFTIQEVVCDDAGKPCALRFIEANTAFERQTGLKQGNTLGHTLRELFPQAEADWSERYGNGGRTG